MLSPELLGCQPLHFLHIGGYEPRIGGVKVILQRFDQREQLGSNLIAKMILQSLVIPVRHHHMPPSGPKTYRLNELRGVEVIHFDHSKTFAPESGFIDRIELTLGLARSALNS